MRDALTTHLKIKAHYVIQHTATPSANNSNDPSGLDGDTHRIEAGPSDPPFGGTLDVTITPGGLPTSPGLYNSQYHVWLASNSPNPATIWSDLCELIDSLLAEAEQFPNS